MSDEIEQQREMLIEAEREARLNYDRIAIPDPAQPNEVMDYLLAEWLGELREALRAAERVRQEFDRAHPRVGLPQRDDC